MVVLLASLDSGPSPLALSSPCTRWSTCSADSEYFYSTPPRLNPTEQDARCSGRPLAPTALFLRLDLARHAAGTSSRSVSPLSELLVPRVPQVRQMLTRCCCSSRSAGCAGTRPAPSLLTHDVSSIPSSSLHKIHRAFNTNFYPLQVTDATIKLEHKTLADAIFEPEVGSGVEHSPRRSNPVRLPSLLVPRPRMSALHAARVDEQS